MTKNAEFERCANFLARMIEKYGNEVDLPKSAEEDISCDSNDDPQYVDKHTDAPERGCLCA